MLCKEPSSRPILESCFLCALYIWNRYFSAQEIYLWLFDFNFGHCFRLFSAGLYYLEVEYPQSDSMSDSFTWIASFILKFQFSVSDFWLFSFSSILCCLHWLFSFLNNWYLLLEVLYYNLLYPFCRIYILNCKCAFKVAVPLVSSFPFAKYFERVYLFLLLCSRHQKSV